jgi:hypothetical protein
MGAFSPAVWGSPQANAGVWGKAAAKPPSPQPATPGRALTCEATKGNTFSFSIPDNFESDWLTNNPRL